MTTSRSPQTRMAPDAIKLTGKAEEGVKWQFTVQARPAARRFKQVMQACVFATPETPTALEALGILAARLICLDGVRPDALDLLSLSLPYRCGEQIAIEWEKGPHHRTERRFIHPLTLSIWPHPPALRAVHAGTKCDPIAPSTASDEAISAHKIPIVHRKVGDLKDPLRLWLRAQGFYINERDPLQTLTSDQLAWWSEHLPGPILTHCAGKSVLTALDRAAWARLDTKQALVPDRPPETQEAPEEYQTDKLLDHLDAAMGSGFDESLLKLALEVLQTKHLSGVDGLTKRLWVEGLLKLNLNLSTNNPCTVVLVGWICHMCEVGTVNSPNPAASTVRQYAGAALLHLGRGLKDFELEPADWKPESLRDLYSSICAVKSVGSRTVTSAALMSFQGYLEEVFDTEHVVAGFDRSATTEAVSSTSPIETEGRRVQASVLWPHEIDWCLNACTMAADARVGQIARVMLAIAKECAVRHQDLSRLVMANITFGADALGGYCQIEVVRRAGRGRLKTTTSQRRLLVRDRTSIQIVQAWHVLRGLETGNLAAYFLGDKNSDKTRYRPAAVQSLLNQLVKQASGCASMRFHDLRHTVICQQVESALTSTALPDINPLQVVATCAGHAIPLTTLRSYSHLYERSLRMSIDVGLQNALQATADQHARAFNALNQQTQPLRGNSLVQAARRRGCSATQHWLRMLDAYGASRYLHLASAPFQWADPAPLKVRATVQKSTSVVVLADAVARLQRGEGIASVARMADIPQPAFEQLHQRLDAWVGDVYRRHFPRKTHAAQELPTLVERLESMRVDAGDCGTEFWAAFSRALDRSVSRDVMQSAVDCWQQHSLGSTISLASIKVGRPIMQLLYHTHLERGNIRVMVQSQKPSPASWKGRLSDPSAHALPRAVPGDPAVINEVTNLFLQELKFNPYLEAVQWRKDRPMAYLRINPHADAAKTAPTAERTAGLRGWLVAIKAWLILEELGGGEHD